MAVRPVFVPAESAPYIQACMTEFTWHSGLSAVQKRRSLASLHESFLVAEPRRRILEISSKSLQPLGVRMSAFSLRKFVPSLGASIPVECAFQGGKVFGLGGPYTDLYAASPRDAKRDPRLKESGMLTGFYYEGRHISPIPRTAFYNWLYVNALFENEEIAAQVLEYDAFTDIEFNPQKSVNCQAEAAALFVSLSRLGKIEACRDYEQFVRLIEGK